MSAVLRQPQAAQASLSQQPCYALVKSGFWNLVVQSTLPGLRSRRLCDCDSAREGKKAYCVTTQRTRSQPRICLWFLCWLLALRLGPLLSVVSQNFTQSLTFLLQRIAPILYLWLPRTFGDPKPRTSGDGLVSVSGSNPPNTVDKFQRVAFILR